METREDIIQKGCDVIHHRTVSQLSLWDRVKVFFGKPVIVESEIWIRDSKNGSGKVLVTGSVSRAHVPPVVVRRSRGG